MWASPAPFALGEFGFSPSLKASLTQMHSAPSLRMPTQCGQSTDGALGTAGAPGVDASTTGSPHAPSSASNAGERKGLHDLLQGHFRTWEAELFSQWVCLLYVNATCWTDADNAFQWIRDSKPLWSQPGGRPFPPSHCSSQGHSRAEQRSSELPPAPLASSGERQWGQWSRGHLGQTLAPYSPSRYPKET